MNPFTIQLNRVTVLTFSIPLQEGAHTYEHTLSPGVLHLGEGYAFDPVGRNLGFSDAVSHGLITPLPDAFPHRALLEAAGLGYVEQVEPLKESDLIALDGIGDVKAQEILNYFVEV